MSLVPCAVHKVPVGYPFYIVASFSDTMLPYTRKTTAGRGHPFGLHRGTKSFMWPAFPPQCETEPTVSWRRGSVLGGRTYPCSYTLGQRVTFTTSPPSTFISCLRFCCSRLVLDRHFRSPSRSTGNGKRQSVPPSKDSSLPHAPITSGVQHHFLNRKTKSIWKCSPAKYFNTFLEASLMPSAAEFIIFNYIYHEMIYKQKLQKGS